MRILALVTDAFGGRGGIAKFNRDFLTALCEISEVEVVTAWPRICQEDIGMLPKKLNYKSQCLGNKLKYIFSVFQGGFEYRDTDILICCHINLLPLACYLKTIGVCKKMVLVIYGLEVWNKRGTWAHFLLNKIDALISISDFTRDKMLDWAPIKDKPYFKIPCGVDLKQFKPGVKDENLIARYGIQGKKVVLTVARLDSRERYKGIDEILEVLSEIKKEIPSIAYLIVGDGDDRGRFEEKVKHLGIADNVVFAGYIPEEEKVAHYRLADVYAMPSRGEGFGIVYLEALACGVPVMGSELDASREVISNFDGCLVVNPNRGEEVSRGLIKCLKGVSGEWSLQLSKFSIDAFKKKISSLLKEF